MNISATDFYYIPYKIFGNTIPHAGLLIKVTGRETVSTKPWSNFGSNGSYSVKS